MRISFQNAPRQNETSVFIYEDEWMAECRPVETNDHDEFVIFPTLRHHDVSFVCVSIYINITSFASFKKYQKFPVKDDFDGHQQKVQGSHYILEE